MLMSMLPKPLSACHLACHTGQSCFSAASAPPCHISRHNLLLRQSRVTLLESVEVSHTSSVSNAALLLCIVVCVVLLGRR